MWQSADLGVDTVQISSSAELFYFIMYFIYTYTLFQLLSKMKKKIIYRTAARVINTERK